MDQFTPQLLVQLTLKLRRAFFFISVLSRSYDNSDFLFSKRILLLKYDCHATSTIKASLMPYDLFII